MTVVALHPPRRCYRCRHFGMTEDEDRLVSSYCFLANEELDDETVAEECPDYQP